MVYYYILKPTNVIVSKSRNPYQKLNCHQVVRLTSTIVMCCEQLLLHTTAIFMMIWCHYHKAIELLHCGHVITTISFTTTSEVEATVTVITVILIVMESSSCGGFGDDNSVCGDMMGSKIIKDDIGVVVVGGVLVVYTAL
ncbi:Hypothetical predicted protein [Octopus vulgaris]|uniref:Uncharacterized protein n=1 Tax=Octopus vulgaris TaxID=6645 RepID=A0AA36AYL2_OCTVU|nr:Hypothetical predicted protein [Octopus vulgaris]